jgi:hypothetical protein
VSSSSQWIPSVDGNQEYVAVAPAKTDRLVPFIRVLFLLVNKHGCPVEIPDDIILSASIESKDTQIWLDPVDPVFAFSI